MKECHIDCEMNVCVLEEQQDVIRELSVMRRHLKSEQKRLEGQLLQSDREDTQTPLKNR